MRVAAGGLLDPENPARLDQSNEVFLQLLQTARQGEGTALACGAPVG